LADVVETVQRWCFIRRGDEFRTRSSRGKDGKVRRSLGFAQAFA
jgi:hypothetical protein